MIVKKAIERGEIHCAGEGGTETLFAGPTDHRCIGPRIAERRIADNTDGKSIADHYVNKQEECYYSEHLYRMLHESEVSKTAPFRAV